jgi:hypothetical protein
MNSLWLLAAASPIEELVGGKPPGKTPLFGPLLTDVILILGAVVLLTVLLLYWAAYIRKPKRNGTASKSYSTRSVRSASGAPEVQIIETPSGRRKWRRRRRDHRPRNPTLAETGGLPPPKSETGKQLPG